MSAASAITVVIADAQTAHSWRLRALKDLNIALKDAAMAATRIHGSYLQAPCRRKCSALGHSRAVGTVMGSYGDTGSQARSGPTPWGSGL
jgi:hypothetical protein